MVSAPSGAGKTTITERLRGMNLVQVSVSHTTRPPRPGEENGREYFFVGRDKFEGMRDNGAFLEWAEVFGNYYGTEKKWVRTRLDAGSNVLLEIDVQGATQIKLAMPEAALIFIRPPSLQHLEERLKKRGLDSHEEVARRLAEAESEMSHAGEYDYVIINDELERAVADARAVMAGGDNAARFANRETGN